MKLLILFISIAFVAPASAQDMSSMLSSAKIKVFKKRRLTGRDQELPFDIIAGGPVNAPGKISITPKGDHWGNPSPKCSNDYVTDIISSHYNSNKELSTRLNDWSSKCNSQLKAFDLLNTIIKFQAVNYDLSLNPQIYEVQFTLRNGEKLSGVLGVKDTKPRPLVISKCGLYCDAGIGSTSKNSFMHLFDEGPFNLLILSSTTGTKFPSSNNSVPVGGFVEGEQIIQVTRLLTADDSSFKSLITDVHVHGISLGGNAAVFAALYASFNPDLPIRSAVATCPVINLESQMNSIFRNSLPGLIGRLLTLDQLNYIYNHLPPLQRHLPKNSFHKNSQKELLHGLSQAALEFYKEQTANSPWPTAPFDGSVFESLDQMWQLNEFKDYVGHIKIPTTILYAEDDFFVTEKINANPLKKALKLTPNDNIGIINVKNGNHCAFSMGIGWDTYSAMLNGLFSKYSSDYSVDRYPASVVSLAGSDNSGGFNTKKDLKNYETIVKSTWEIKENSDFANLKVKVFNSRKFKRNPRRVKVFKCSLKTPYDGYSHCYKDYTTKVALSSLEALNIKRPASGFEANRMTRWLNTNTHLTNMNYGTIEGTQKLPSFVNYKAPYEFN